MSRSSAVVTVWDSMPLTMKECAVASSALGDLACFLASLEQAFTLTEFYVPS